jgi:polyhydroxybutyrate depolymerase
MPRRRSRLQWSLAALAAACVALLTVGAWTPQAPPATAAEDAAPAAATPTPAPPACVPKPGNRILPGEALLHIPPHAKAPLPLVMVFHGAGGEGPGMADYSGMSQTGDKYGFAVLYPTAGSSRHFWSLNRSMHPDDLGALRALLPQAIVAACADPTRVYATGVSNGGGFAARVGCEMSDQIAAIAPVAGGYRALDPCPDGHQTSVLEIHGTSDNVVPYGGVAPDYAGAVLKYLGGWVQRDGCSATPVKTRPRKGVVRYTHKCSGGLSVQHLTLSGTDHGWPGAQPPFPHHNPSGLIANEEIWRFFSAHVARSASVGESRAARSAG